MEQGDARLYALRQKVERKAQLDQMLAQLDTQFRQLRDEVDQLRKKQADEQDDVKRLEGHTPSAMLYHVLGRHEQQLEKERAEALEADRDCTAAAQKLAALKSVMDCRTNERAQLDGCEEEYFRALDKKAAALLAAGGGLAGAVERIEQRMSAVQQRHILLLQALDIGRDIVENLDKALAFINKSYMPVPFLLCSDQFDLSEHALLDKAQLRVDDVNVQLMRLQQLLQIAPPDRMEATVDLQPVIRVTVDGFLRTADRCLDGFCDAIVHGHTEKAEKQVKQLKLDVEYVVRRLDESARLAAQQLHALEKQWAQLLCDAPPLDV